MAAAPAMGNAVIMGAAPWAADEVADAAASEALDATDSAAEDALAATDEADSLADEAASLAEELCSRQYARKIPWHRQETYAADEMTEPMDSVADAMAPVVVVTVTMPVVVAVASERAEVKMARAPVDAAVASDAADETAAIAGSVSVRVSHVR